MSEDIGQLAADVDEALARFEQAARAYVARAIQLDRESRRPGGVEHPVYGRAHFHLNRAVERRLDRLVERAVPPETIRLAAVHE